MSKDSSKEKRRREEAGREVRKSFGELQEVLAQSGYRDLMVLDDQARSYDAVAYRAYLAAREEAEAAQRALEAMMRDAEQAFGRLGALA
ncbi:MAG: hypothetical protein J6S63_03425 [Atopobiaceae bacterium]|nr:hypothetical protein [Atopobiaceae bacterium]